MLVALLWPHGIVLPRATNATGGVCAKLFIFYFLYCVIDIYVYTCVDYVCVCVCDVGDDEKASVFFKTQKTKKKTNKKASLFTQKCEYVSYPIV